MKLIGVVIYFGILLAIGFVASRRMKGLREYFVANKSLGFLSVAFSARATGESAWLLLGLTGLGAMAGVRGFWVVLGEILGVGASWLLLARPFKRRTDQYDSVTVPDYLESRFKDRSHGIRLIAAIALVVNVVIYVSAQIDATGSAFESFLGWNYTVGALVGFGVVVTYVLFGGFVAIVWSDVFQGFLMLIGLVVLPVVGLITIGGFGTAASSLHVIDPTLSSFSGGEPWGLIPIVQTLALVFIGLGFLGSPQIFVRFIALKSEREIPRGTIVALVWTLLADVGAVCTGMVGRALLTKEGQDTAILGAGGQDVLPLLTEVLFPPLWVGLYVAIVLAAIMSTVDSLLVVASSAAVRDFYQKVLRPDLRDDQLLRVSRVVTFGIALVALAVAMVVANTAENRTIFWFVVFGWSGIAATFCPTIVLSLFWAGFTARGAKVAMLAGFFSVPIFKFAAPRLPGMWGEFFGALEELTPSFIVSLCAGIGVSLFDRAGRERLSLE